MKRLFLLTCATGLLCASQAHAQTTVYPMGGVGTLQFFDNNGVALSTGALYFYAAGTSTAQATYTDSSGTIVNQNPLPLTTAGRATAWLTGQSYKIVLCSVSTDGANCAGAHILQSVDQVPGNFGASSGSASSPFTSSSSNPATTGILRLASSDSTCWRNAANSANLCWSKDSSDRLIWAGGSLFFPEVGAPTGAAASDLLWADNSAHRWKVSNNGGTAANLVISGADINTSDQVTVTHLASPLPTAQGGTGQNSLTGLTLPSATLSSPTISTPTTSSPTINTGITNSGSGFQHVQSTACSSSGLNCMISWNGGGFADTSYTVTCMATGAVANYLAVDLLSKSAGSITVDVFDVSTAVASASSEVDCIGVHN